MKRIALVVLFFLCLPPVLQKFYPELMPVAYPQYVSKPEKPVKVSPPPEPTKAEARMGPCSEMETWLKSSLSNDDWPYVRQTLNLTSADKTERTIGETMQAAKSQGLCD